MPLYKSSFALRSLKPPNLTSSDLLPVLISWKKGADASSKIFIISSSSVTSISSSFSLSVLSWQSLSELSRSNNIFVGAYGKEDDNHQLHQTNLAVRCGRSDTRNDAHHLGMSLRTMGQLICLLTQHSCSLMIWLLLDHLFWRRKFLEATSSLSSCYTH